MKNLDYIRDFPGGPMVKTPPSSACGGGLFGKLWSHMPWGVAKIFKNNINRIKYLRMGEKQIAGNCYCKT